MDSQDTVIVFSMSLKSALRSENFIRIRDTLFDLSSLLFTQGVENSREGLHIIKTQLFIIQLQLFNAMNIVFLLIISIKMLFTFLKCDNCNYYINGCK